MKPIMLTIAAFILTLTASAADTPGKHLFILSGQSNMAGLKSDFVFNPIVEKAFGEDNVIVVRYARSGQPIRKWFSLQKDPKTDKPIGGHKIYDHMMAEVKDKVNEQKLATVTFIWMQGETDAGEKKGDVYEASLKGLIAEVKKELKIEKMNIVIGRICDWDKEHGKNPHWKMVRDAQVKVAEDDPNGAWVDTDDLNDKKDKDGKTRNALHYTGPGYKMLGQRFAEKAIELIKKQASNK